jgi:hypothetical protein
MGALQQAKTESMNCPFCGGEGMVTIFHRDYEGIPSVLVETADGFRKSKVLRATAYCACTAGQTISVNHQHTAKDVYDRTPSLRILMGNPGSLWSSDDPSTPKSIQQTDWGDQRHQVASLPLTQNRPESPTRASIFGAGPRAKPPAPHVVPTTDDEPAF